jgi:hypothetical protein
MKKAIGWFMLSFATFAAGLRLCGLPVPMALMGGELLAMLPASIAVMED